VPVLEQVLKNYPEEVKIVFKHFPRPNRESAMTAAFAAQGAESYGKFWEFHDLLFKNSEKLSDQKIQDIAQELGIAQTDFQQMIKDPIIQEKVNQDILEGRQAGVNGTPAVFINGRFLRNRSLDAFQAVIDKELQKLAKKDAKPGS